LTTHCNLPGVQPLSPDHFMTEGHIMGLLDGILGGNKGGMSPITVALLGLLAYRTMNGKGRLADMLGTSKPGNNPTPDNPAPPAGGGLGGGLGGLLQGGLGGLLGGGAAGSVLSGGLNDLLKQFQDHGQGDKANSWVADGPNQTISPGELEQALGAERIEWLTQQTGMSKEDLLAGLSRELPDAVNKLTPQGRIPTEQEAQRLA
jgi:uncharacterized protein YidB (DUF937 family)